ncbi:MAG: protoporphyrinogen oxidase [Candidatus Dormibacteria bacterium]
MSQQPRRVAVIGGGVSGLAASRAIARGAASAGAPVELILLEADDRLGGRVLTADFAGTKIDLGPESILARGTDTWKLLADLGIEAAVLRPGTTSAGIWNGRRLVPIPKGFPLSIPPQLTWRWRWDVIRAIGPLPALRASVEPWLKGQVPDPDQALGPFISARLGRAVFRRLVDPLMGGIYAGSAEQLSIGAVAPQLLQALRLDSSLLHGLRRMSSPPPPADGSPPTTFITLEGGLTRLVEALAAALPAGTARLGTRVAELAAGPAGSCQLRFGEAPPLEVDGVVLALPAPRAAELLSGLAPGMSDQLCRQDYASVATVTLAYRDQAFPRPLTGSGLLVPRSPRRVVTACTFMDRKWPHLRQPGTTILRVSTGSLGEEWVLGLDDTTLVSSVHRSLRTMLGVTELPSSVRVQRWPQALAQYRAGHLAWAAQLQQQAGALPIKVVLTGASYQGVGLAACLRDGTEAGQRLWDRLAPSPPHGTD